MVKQADLYSYGSVDLGIQVQLFYMQLFLRCMLENGSVDARLLLPYRRSQPGTRSVAQAEHMIGCRDYGDSRTPTARSHTPLVRFRDRYLSFCITRLCSRDRAKIRTKERISHGVDPQTMKHDFLWCEKV